MSNREETQPVDLDRLRKKYSEEREKRLRPDGVGQYRSLTGTLSKFDQDPFATTAPARPAQQRDVDVLIVGGGIGGLLAGAHLRQAGVEKILIADRAGDVGGTWYWNRYPGIRCDIDALVYLPMLEETGFVPTEKYAKGAEILDQCKRIAQLFDLYRDALFQTTVTKLAWDDRRLRWIARTDRGDAICARFVIACTGLLSHPKLPGIPGIETFQGHSFHTSRWDFAYTGGNADGNLTGLAGKRIGVIGTGSTGIQCIPHIANWARHLYVFQRTPCSIDVRGNKPTDNQWASTLKPGWQHDRVWNFTYWTSGVRQGTDMVADSWTNLLGEPTAVTGGPTAAGDPEELRRAQILKMETVRRRIESIVNDKATAEALKPYYDYFCKRPGFSDDYLQTFNRGNVTLVDTNGQGVERITPRGAVVAGREYELDCIIYATGFDFMTGIVRESGLDIVGLEGKSLQEHWSRGAHTLYGMLTRGFPNFFVMSLIQAGIGINYTHIADAQTSYIAHVISQCMNNDVATVEPKEMAENAWVAEIMAKCAPRRAFLEACTPGYFNYEGRRDAGFELNEPYGGGAIEYLRILEKAGTASAIAELECDRRKA